MDMGKGHGLGSWVVDHGMWAMLRGPCYLAHGTGAHGTGGL